MPSAAAVCPQRGFSLVEILIAMTLSVLLLGGVMTLFANSRKTYESNERLARLQENGRFALDQMMYDIRSAGYKGCARRIVDISAFNNMLYLPDSLLWNFAVPIQGYDASGAAWLPAVDGLITSPKVGNDILIVRGPVRESRTMRLTASMASPTADPSVADPGTPDIKAKDVVMAGNCREASVFVATTYTHNTTTGVGVIGHAGTATAPSDFITPANTSDSVLTPFDDLSQVTPVQTVVYYVRDNAANVPTLYRRSGPNDPVEIIDGIDAMQVLYGVDSDGNLAVEDYLSAKEVADANSWGNVISVSIGILVRSIEAYGTDKSTQKYRVLDTEYGPFNDRHQRMVFTTTATVRNQTQ